MPRKLRRVPKDKKTGLPKKYLSGAKNKRVPKQIYDQIQKSSGQEKKDFQRLIEGLYVLAIEDEDFDILNKYFG